MRWARGAAPGWGKRAGRSSGWAMPQWGPRRGPPPANLPGCGSTVLPGEEMGLHGGECSCLPGTFPLKLNPWPGGQGRLGPAAEGKNGGNYLAKSLGAWAVSMVPTISTTFITAIMSGVTVVTMPPRNSVVATLAREDCWVSSPAPSRTNRMSLAAIYHLSMPHVPHLYNGIILKGHPDEVLSILSGTWCQEKFAVVIIFIVMSLPSRDAVGHYRS